MTWKALAGSLASHGVVLGVLFAVTPSRASRPAADAPIDVVFQDQEVAPQAPARTAEPPAPSRSTTRTQTAATTTQTPRPRAIESPARAIAPIAPPSATVVPSWMTMRTPHDTDEPVASAPSVPSASGAAALEVGPPGPPADPLLADGDAPPGPMAPTLGVPDGNGGFKYKRETFDARVNRDGTVRFHDKPNVGLDGVGVQGGGLLGLAGHFDITDALMRLHGEDPYQYEKMAFLDRTRDQRAAMAMVDRSERLRDSIAGLPAYLGHLWTSSRWTTAEKRALLFALWDESVEDDANGSDDELATAGQEARATIVAFVRRTLPSGGPDAFTADELSSLNAQRQSRARFDPYAP